MVQPIGRTSLKTASEIWIAKTAPLGLSGIPDLLGTKSQGKSLCKAFSALKTRTYDLFSWVQTLLKRIFFCFKKTPDQMHLEALQQSLPAIENLSRLFVVQRKEKNIEALKIWWKHIFNDLPTETQRLILLEDIKTRAPEDVEDKSQWAEKHFGENRGLAMGFVVNLDPERINGHLYTPVDDVPALLENTTHAMRVEMQKLGSQ